MLKLFIKRPVLSTVISLLIVLLGVLGLIKLPVSQYPDISPPTVQVTATYSGASADVVLKTVIVPLEQQINGVEGMTYMSSVATNEGVATISVYFQIGVDPNQAAVDVQNRIAAATSVLPPEVIQAGVIARKQQSSNLLVFSIYSDNPAYDQVFLQNYAAINVVPQLQRVNGVGAATVFGATKLYSMRIWMKPDVMTVYGITPQEVINALKEQNIEAAPGKFGENDNQVFQYVIRYRGKFQKPDEFGNIIIKSVENGQYLRLKDVARLELGSQTYNGSTFTDGKMSVGIAISQTPGSNARDVINNSKKVIEKAAGTFPAGIKFVYLVDINQFLDASIEKVIHTLLECFALVFLVIFIFLQDFRSTIIHGISVPVSILGTFFFLYVFGYSINLLTLFALVLAIGIVVDDAIVVVEAVHAKLESGYKSPRKAAIDAMGEIAGAIVSITLVMAAVFLPVTFLTGSAGVFYKQFGITLAVAIIISAVNALTLCPALAALFLRPPAHVKEKDGEERTGENKETGDGPQKEHVHKTRSEPEPGEKKGLLKRFSIAFNAAYDAMTEKYARVVKFLALKQWLVVIIIAFFGAGFYLLMRSTPTSFVPNEDMGTIFVNITMPPASTMERVMGVARRIDSVAHSIPQVARTLRTMGQNFVGGSGSSYGMVILRLKPWGDRKGVTNTDIIKQLTKKTAAIREADIVFMSQPTITGFGTNGGFALQLQDKEGGSLEAFYKVAQDFMATLSNRPEIQYASTSFNPNFPQYLMDVNVARCKDANIPVTDVLNTMQAYYGSYYVTTFNEFGQQYRVIVQADTNYRASIAGLTRVSVKTGDGTMAPITEFVSLNRVFGPENLTRFNLFTSISINGSPKEGFSTGQAITAIKEVAAQTLPSGYGFEFSGISREEENSGSQTLYVFLLCLAFVYLLLSAKYESYLLPFAVLLSLPVGLSGVFVFAKLFNLDDNIYVQISMIMLVGLLAKNAILMVEFSVERRKKGMELLESAIEGAKARLRPILMTSFAFVFGLMPLMFSKGVGAHGNQSIGTGAIGGMLFGTLLGVFIIPALYVMFQGLQEKLRGNKKEDDEDDDDDSEDHSKKQSTKKTESSKDNNNDEIVIKKNNDDSITPTTDPEK